MAISSRFPTHSRRTILAGLVPSLLLAGCATLLEPTPLNKSANLIREGQFSQAVESASLAIAADPKSALGYVNRALAYQSLNQYDLAAQDYQQALRLAPDSGVTHLNYVHLLLAMRRTEEAQNLARRYYSGARDEQTASITLATALEATGNDREAKRLCWRALERLEGMSPGTGELQFVKKSDLLASGYALLAIIESKLGDHDAAARSVERARALQPGLAVQHARATMFANRGDCGAATRVVAAALSEATSYERHSPTGAKAKFLQANCFLRLGELEQARRAYEEFLEVNRYEPEAYVNLGRIHAEQGRYSEAIDAYDSALRIQPRLVLALENRAALRLRDGSYAEAVKDLDAALAVEPNNLGLRYKRAYANCARGELDQAARDIQTILRQQPQHAEARVLQDRCVSE